MSENIGLKITLNGITEVVTDIDKLKGSIDNAKKTLGGLEEGTFVFEQLTEEINLAEAALKGFEETAGEMNAPQKMGLLKQAGELVGSAFSAANQTLKRFGIDTEQIGNSAKRVFQSIKKPLDDMTSSLEKTGEKLQQIPGPIGQFAQGIRGVAQAMKILLANPIIAFLAAIVGALTLLYKAFTSTKAGAEQMERIFAALGAVVDVLRDRFLKFASAVGKLFTLDLKGAVEDFRGSVSGIGAEIVKEAQEAARIKGILQQITDQTRELNKERARQNVLIADAKLRINDENLSLEDRIKALNEIRNSEISLAKQEEELARRRYEAIRAQNALSDSSKEALDEEAQAYITYQNLILQSKQKQKELFDQEKALRDRQRAEQKAAADERIRQLKETQDAVIKSIEVEISLFERLKEVQEVSVPEPQVLTNLKQILQVVKDLGMVVTETTFDEDFSNKFQNLIPPIEEAANKVDKFGAEFILARRKLSASLLTLSPEFGKVASDIKDSFSEKLQAGEITKEAFDALMSIVKEYENVNQLITKEPLKGGLFDPITYFQLIKQVKVATGEITKDVRIVNGEIQGTRGVAKVELSSAVKDLESYIKSVQPQIRKYLEDTEKDFKKLSPEQQSEQIKKYSDNLFIALNKNVDAAIKEEQRIIDFFDQAVITQTERQGELFSAQLGFIAQNSDKLVKQLTDIYGFNSEQVEIAFDERIKQLVGERELTEEELEQITLLYQIFYEKLNQQRQQNETQVKTGFEKTQEYIVNLGNSIQEFQGVLNSLSQLTAEYYGFQLEELDRQNQEIQDKIVGDNEEAIKKRLEAEQIYQEKRKQLEKEQAVAALKLDIGQAIANAALAITKTFGQLGGTPAAFIASAIVAGINTAQIGLLTQQLAAVQSMQRGGIIRKGQGGLVVGPSHEYGGVKYQGGGIELEGGESVINRVSSVRYNDLLNQINLNGGGKPLVQNNFDDSRIVEAISRQRSEPIRAYVLESEITQKQGVNRRLEQLSSL